MLINVCTARWIIFLFNFLKFKNYLINNNYLSLIIVCATVQIIFLFNKEQLLFELIDQLITMLSTTIQFITKY